MTRRRASAPALARPERLVGDRHVPRTCTRPSGHGSTRNAAISDFPREAPNDVGMICRVVGTPETRRSPRHCCVWSTASCQATAGDGDASRKRGRRRCAASTATHNTETSLLDRMVYSSRRLLSEPGLCLELAGPGTRCWLITIAINCRRAPLSAASLPCGASGPPTERHCREERVGGETRCRVQK